MTLAYIVAATLLGGVLSGRVKIATIRALLKGMKNGSRAEALYADYPAEEAGYEAWVARAEKFWKRCGSMAENAVR